MKLRTLSFLFPLLVTVNMDAQQAGDFNDGLRAVNNPVPDNTTSVRWWGRPEHYYFIEYSLNMFDWDYYDYAFTGNGSVIEVDIESSADTMFFRVYGTDDDAVTQYFLIPDDSQGGTVFPMDSDGDGLSDVDEIARGTNPLNKFSYVEGIEDSEWVAWYKADAIDAGSSDVIFANGGYYINNWSDSVSSNDLLVDVRGANQANYGPFLVEVENGVKAVEFTQLPTGDKWGPSFYRNNFAAGTTFNAEDSLKTFSIAWLIKPNCLESNTFMSITNGDYYYDKDLIIQHALWDGRIWVLTNSDVDTLNYTDVGFLELDKWQYFVFTFNDGVCRLYKNGKLRAEQAGLPIPRVWQKFRFFDKAQAYLTELAVFDSALTQAQVHALGESMNERTNGLLDYVYSRQLAPRDEPLLYDQKTEKINGSENGISIGISSPPAGEIYQ